MMRMFVALQIYWKDDKEWYPGTVVGFQNKKTTVLYDDGETESVNLEKEKFRVVRDSVDVKMSNLDVCVKHPAWFDQVRSMFLYLPFMYHVSLFESHLVCAFQTYQRKPQKSTKRETADYNLAALISPIFSGYNVKLPSLRPDFKRRHTEIELDEQMSTFWKQIALRGDSWDERVVCKLEVLAAAY